jgi:hypothetical protein
VKRRAVRSLGRLAMENAVEGCVRETYGALLACWQAQSAGDADFRTAMVRIAEDEARHAELAWAIARWAEPRLERGAQRRVKSARHAAWRALETELACAQDSDLRRTVGIPAPSLAVRMMRELESRSLWEI